MLVLVLALVVRQWFTFCMFSSSQAMPKSTDARDRRTSSTMPSCHSLTSRLPTPGTATRTRTRWFSATKFRSYASGGRAHSSTLRPERRHNKKSLL